MRRQIVSFLAGFAAVLLVQMPLPAAPASITPGVGVVMQADRAYIATYAAAGGATIFDGDALSTDPQGSLRVRFGAGQAYLLPKTAITVHGIANGYRADLSQGAVVLSSGDNQTFELMADGVLIRPSTPAATVAQVTVISASELLLVSRKGPLEVSLDGSVKTVAEGTSYRLEVEPEAADPQTNGPVPTAKSHKRLLAVLLVGAGVGTGIAIWHAVESPSTAN